MSSSSAAGFSTHLPSTEQIKNACANVGRVLGSNKYAVVGGAACIVLGSTRITEDVDFVVPRGGVPSARKLIAAEKATFVVEPRTLHTHYKSNPPVEIEILAPPGTFKEEFNQDTSTISVQVGDHPVSVLHPVLILNAKCRSVLGRATDGKKGTDAEDIKFLLQHLAVAGILPTSEQLPNVTKAFVEWFVATYQDGHLWEKAGYDANTGRFRSS